MKNTLTRLLTLLLLFTSGPLLAQSLTFKPEYPAPGESITIHYNPKADIDAKHPTAQVYLLDVNQRPVVKEIKLSAHDDYFDGNIDKLVDELSIMIELAGEATEKGTAMSMN